jgi:hypothetical protein
LSASNWRAGVLQYQAVGCGARLCARVHIVDPLRTWVITDVHLSSLQVLGFILPDTAITDVISPVPWTKFAANFPYGYPVDPD